MAAMFICDKFLNLFYEPLSPNKRCGIESRLNCVLRCGDQSKLCSHMPLSLPVLLLKRVFDQGFPVLMLEYVVILPRGLAIGLSLLLLYFECVRYQFVPTSFLQFLEDFY